MTFSVDLGIDLVAYNRKLEFTLLAEISKSTDSSEQWAAQYRRNILSNQDLPHAKFFLIATPAQLYFWRQDQPNGLEDMPEFVLDTALVFQPYLDRLKLPLDLVGQASLAWMLSEWLTDIAESKQAAFEQAGSTRWLTESGFVSSLAGNRVELNTE